jgi:hypothetical protein
MATLNLNQSRVKMFRRCQKQYSFRYDYPELFGGTKRQEMVPKKKKLPLYRGTWMHALQEALHWQWAGYRAFSVQVGTNIYDVSSWQELHEDLCDEFDKLFDEEKEELGDIDLECERLFKSYLRFWKQDLEKYDVAIIEDKPAIELIVDVALPGFENVHFKGKIDLVVEDAEYGGLWVWDAKWVKNIPAPDERMMSPQALMYVWALRQMGYDIRGFVYNYGKTKAPAIPYVLKRSSKNGPAGSVTMRQKLDTDLATYVRAIKEAHGKDWKKWIPYYKPKLEQLRGRDALWFRRERIPTEDSRIEVALEEYKATARDILKRSQVAPRSYFFNCKFGCEYHDLCVSEFSGLDITPLIKHNFIFEGERYGEEDLLAA